MAFNSCYMGDMREYKKLPQLGPRKIRGSKRGGFLTLGEVQKVFASQQRVSGFPEKGADLRRSSGEVWGTAGDTPGLLLSSTVRDLPGKSSKTSGEVWGTC